MLRSILHITGLEQKLQAVKDRIEGQAQGLIQQGKAVAIQMSIAASLAIGAAILALMALVAALLTLFFWLEPKIGSIAAMGLLAGGLLVVGAVLAVWAVVIGRRPTPAITPPVPTADIAAARMAEEFAPIRAEPIGRVEPPPARSVTADEVESLFAVAGQFARLPQTGIESVDNVLRTLAPKAEEATREAVARAANLVRHGDRSTVLAILGTALAIGWVMTKLHHQSTAKTAFNS